MKSKYADALDKLFYGEVPEYIVDAGKSFMTIRAGSEWEPSKVHKITIDDLAYFYANDARNITSGCRRLGKNPATAIVGDWRPISELADMCLAYFKLVNVEGMRRAVRPYSDIMTPKF